MHVAIDAMVLHGSHHEMIAYVKRLGIEILMHGDSTLFIFFEACGE